jgi:diguanylate cyclase (GGDEF)-like protein
MFIKIWFKDIKKLLIIIFILSLFFLNLEIWLSHSNFIIINLFATIVFVMLLLIVYKIQSTIKSQNIYNKQYYYDLVTNVRNYYCLLEYSASILSRKNSNIAFILINIDHLKDINNLYGVYFGNKVIKLVAEIIKKNISDFGDDYRIDGDTFCVVSNEKYKIIKTICDRIRHEIDIKEVITDNNKINISVSIGAYCGLIYSKNIDDYIELAQDALFKSKSLGRNKVIINNLEDK